MAVEKLQFTGKANVKTFAKELLARTNIRLDERIVQAIDENSYNTQSLSAKELYNLLNILNTTDATIVTRLDEDATTISEQATELDNINAEQIVQDGNIATVEGNISALESAVDDIEHLTIEVVEGPITSITAPSSTVLYLQRDDENDPSWNIWVYTEHGWVCVGDTELDLSGYWSKDENEALKEALGFNHDAEGITDIDIEDMVETGFTEETIDLRDVPEGEPTIPATVQYGTPLSSVPIEGTMMYDGEVVEGTFEWVTTDEEFAAMVEAAMAENSGTEDGGATA